VLVLLGVGFLGGLVTGLSPCVVPVLPAIVAGGSSGGSRRRPYAVVAGLVASFTAFTLVGGELLRLLHLPQDFLRDLGLVLLVVLAVGLVVPQVGELLERPFARLGAGRVADTGGGFVLGASLGLVFVPCAGPVLAAISAVAATDRVGVTAVLLTLAYAAGVAVPLLVLAVVARRAMSGWGVLRRHLPAVRRVAGVVLGLTALVIALDLTTPLVDVPGYTSSLEDHVEQSAGASQQLASLQGEHGPNASAGQTAAAGALPDLGRAPGFTGISRWLNTPGGRPLSIAGLRGRVVLVDFWTYSCINCQRELPHVEAWYRAYHRDGLEVVGVHTPEFPFEHVVGNVAAAAQHLGVRFPVAIDDRYQTWDAYRNEYWPAEYLVDQNGEIRHTAFGEGGYATTEEDIRLLLAAGGAHHLPPPTGLPNRAPMQLVTTETYLGSTRFDGERYVGSPVVARRAAHYQVAASVPTDDLSLGGTWTQEPWELTAGAGAELALRYQASDVYLVLGGHGSVQVSVDGVHRATVEVAGVPDLYTLLSSTMHSSGLLTVRLSPGVMAYDFTFG
jgi:cytochrome c biogenesis protein CcdA/thiol-disulfide isomerase/thioredoxin